MRLKKINEDDLADFLEENGLALLDTQSMGIIMPSGYNIGDHWTVFSSGWNEEKGFKSLLFALKNANKRKQ